MTLPLHNPHKGPLRVLGYASGSGATLFRALEMARTLDATREGSPFQIVGIFSENPNAKALETARSLGIPQRTLDLRAFYALRGKPLGDREVRAAFDRESMALWEDLAPDLILLAGYVWATTADLIEALPVVNVHPADLSVHRNGKRAYAGAHGIEDALAAGERELRASSHLATAELDGGPLLVVSPPVPVPEDEALSPEDRTRACLRLVNDQSRLVGARTLYEIACGHFATDEGGILRYRGNPVPDGLRFDCWERCRILPERSVEALIRPKSVAVLGASPKPGIGRAVLENLQAFGFPGPLYPVNRDGAEVAGLTGYASVAEIPGGVDLALFCLPASQVLPLAERCAEVGVKALVGVAAGFGETGPEGALAERRLVELVDQGNMRLLGPNCMGVLNTDPSVRLHADILQTLPEPGGVSFVTQSGAIGAALLDFAKTFGIGFSKIVSTGNQADVTLNDLMPLLEDDEKTRVVLAYLETLPDAARFRRCAEALTRKKSLVVLKSGRTPAGAAAARSHTGSLAGDDRLADALLRQSGAVRAESLEEAFLLASALPALPALRGHRVGVVSNAGGPGTLVADALSAAGFDLPLLSEDLRRELAEKILPEASTGNPLDLVATAKPAQYAEAARILGASGLYDALVVLVVPPATVDTRAVAEALLPPLKAFPGPVLTCFFGPELGLEGRETLRAAGFPSVPFPEQTVQVLARLRERSRREIGSPWKGMPTPGMALRRDLRRRLHSFGKGFLPPLAARDLLLAYDLRPAATFDAAARPVGARSPSGSWVVKIDHEEVLHKSDAGGVLLNVEEQDLDRATASLRERFPGARGILIQEMLAPGTELILGAVRDDALGHGVLVGMGGVGVEVFNDTALLHVPFSPEVGRAALEGLRCFPLLRGYRGKAGIDPDNVVRWMGRLAALLQDFPEIAELDLNPVIVGPKGLTAADWRIRVG